MPQFYIIEIQLLSNGEYAHLVHWAYDADPKTARLKAESKYHTILASAAISETKTHSATLLTGDGVPIMHQCYTHDLPEPEPTPEPEPEPEGEEEPEDGEGE